MSNELLEFTRRALAADIDRDKIAAALAEAGWPQARIRSSLSRYSASDFPIPVPAPRAAFSARETFVYLLLFLAMTMCVWHLAALAFQIVDVFLRDPAVNATSWVGTEGFNSQVRWNLSTLLVAYPIFAALFFVTSRRQVDARAHRLSLARRWLTYLALFTAVITLIGDVIVFVSTLIGGGLTTPLFAKIVIVAVVVGGIFAYYLTLMVREEAE